MIKINLLGEKKRQPKARTAPAFSEGGGGGGGGGNNLLLALILIVGVAVAGGWWYLKSNEEADWKEKVKIADAELERLKPIREKAERYEKHKALLERKINLITELKKRQSVPVHILDQISRSLPDFLWLSKMTADRNKITISGRATTYNAVSNFYNNLTSSGFFNDVNLGRTSEGPDGVTFSLTCSFVPDQSAAPAAAPQG